MRDDKGTLSLLSPPRGLRDIKAEGRATTSQDGQYLELPSLSGPNLTTATATTTTVDRVEGTGENTCLLTASEVGRDDYKKDLSLFVVVFLKIEFACACVYVA